MEKIAAVIVTYNRLALLKECLQAVLEQSKKVCSIVVINNDMAPIIEKVMGF